MSGTIKHSWNGTVLTITSDSGTSSADLKGATGDTGIRGPQGPQGNSTSVDLSNYYDKQETDMAIINSKQDLTPYALREEIPSIEGLATEEYVNRAVDSVQVGEMDLSGYYNKTETDAQLNERVIYSGSKNMFNIASAKSNSSSASVSVDGDTIRVKSLSAGTYHSCKSNVFKIKANVAYTISATVLDISAGTAVFALRLAVAHGGNNVNYIVKRETPKTTGRFSFTYTPTEDLEVYTSVFCTYSTSEVGDVTFSDVMVEEGEAATDYQRYYKGLEELTNAYSFELAWENAKPDDEFANQLIGFEKKNATMFAVESDGSLFFVNGSGEGSIRCPSADYYIFRLFYVTTNGIQFYSARTFAWSGGTSLGANNALAIPHRIYRVKGMLE